ncbi:MBL fold metallo-hydrolase [Salidesulfovibrio brasiliensis]|uniref:MBL fold metallo-hydrolase n=1 Tax=Salidesulfovibrio brasiliensis TaxID=221711 RepID=UPI0006D16DA2|nr:MBL fold metallo-hydrolase [Salidesulfovibrio brasiliensis]
MIVRCWGARGGIAVSGTRFDRFGGDTCCIEVRDSDGRVLIIDAGTGIRRLGKRLVDEGVPDCDLFFTHFHWDHLMGLPFFRAPHHFAVRINGDPLPGVTTEEVLNNVVSPPYFPVPFAEFSKGMEFCPFEGSGHFGNIAVTAVPLSHPGGGSGYRFEENGKSFVFLTDNELSYQHDGGLTLDGYAEFAKNADLLVHDAEYLPEEYPAHRQWGHSHWLEAVDLAEKAGVRALGLFHHGASRYDGEVAEIVESCRSEIRDRELRMDCFAMAADVVIRL